MATNTGNRAPANQPAAPTRGPAPLNPERIPPLAGKYAKMLGKEVSEIIVRYTATGSSVGFRLPSEGGKEGEIVSLASLKEAKKRANEPDDDEKQKAFRNKYELRLNKEFPKAEYAAATAAGKTADDKIQAFIESLPFRERRALLMTQKQFATAYPNGYTQA